MATLMNLSKEEIMTYFPDDNSKKVGEILYGKGYKDAMNFCTSKLKVLEGD